METNAASMITIGITVNAPIEIVWSCWNNPADIMQWNNSDEDWHNLKVDNDLRIGGKFLFAMAKKDGTQHFNFEGVYDKVVNYQLITYTLTDGRKTTLTFTGINPVHITETFDPEPGSPAQLQHDFCSAVLHTFKVYTEHKLP